MDISNKDIYSEIAQEVIIKERKKKVFHRNLSIVIIVLSVFMLLFGQIQRMNDQKVSPEVKEDLLTLHQIMVNTMEGTISSEINNIESIHAAYDEYRDLSMQWNHSNNTNKEEHLISLIGTMVTMNYRAHGAKFESENQVSFDDAVDDFHKISESFLEALDRK